MAEKYAVIATVNSNSITWVTHIDKAKDFNCAVPIGTVEFIESFAALVKIKIITIDTYPQCLLGYLKRDIFLTTYGAANDLCFVKPVKTKLFTGAIKNRVVEYADINTPVWESEPVKFTQEWRCYILEKKMIGFARYDEFDDDDIEPPIDLINNIITDFIGAPIGYSIDMGICERGWCIVEINDGWSLGFYKGTITKCGYVALVTKRWNEIRLISKFNNETRSLND